MASSVGGDSGGSPKISVQKVSLQRKPPGRWGWLTIGLLQLLSGVLITVYAFVCKGPKDLKAEILPLLGISFMACHVVYYHVLEPKGSTPGQDPTDIRDTGCDYITSFVTYFLGGLFVTVVSSMQKYQEELDKLHGGPTLVLGLFLLTHGRIKKYLGEWVLSLSEWKDPAHVLLNCGRISLALGVANVLLGIVLLCRPKLFSKNVEDVIDPIILAGDIFITGVSICGIVLLHLPTGDLEDSYLPVSPTGP